MKKLFALEVDSHRIFGLDILRALAILFVVVVHGNYILPAAMQEIVGFFIFDGVSIFFVLSGFLIGKILIKTFENQRITKGLLVNFWVRRWLRTLPNYFFVLLIICILNYFFQDGFTFHGIYKYFFFSQNLFTPHPDFFPEAWSLSIEECFYLLVPLLMAAALLIFKTSSKKTILYVAIFVIVAVTCFRIHRYFTIPVHNFYEWDIYFRKQVVTRLDSIMFGVIGSYMYFFYPKQWIKNKKPVFFFGIFLFSATRFLLPEFVDISGFYYAVFSLTTTSVATLCLLPYLSEIKKGFGIICKSITYISVISYSMYLLNLSIVRTMIIEKIPFDVFISNGYLQMALKYGLYWFLVIILSALLYKYFEMPMTNLRNNPKIKRLLQSPSANFSENI